MVVGGAAMNLYDGIFVRQSIRSFILEPINQQLLDNILNFANHLECLSGSCEVRYEIINMLQEKSKKSQSILFKAPYYFVLYSKKTDGYLLNAGYLLEHICLYMTTKGLATCFIQNTGKEKDGYEPILKIAFGKSDKDLYRDAKKAKRLNLGDLCVFKENVKEEVITIVKAARMAPSSYNSQPWRLVAYENHIHLFCKKERFVWKHIKKLHEIDMGIVLANICIGAEEVWYTTELVKLENILEQNFRKNKYVITITWTG